MHYCFNLKAAALLSITATLALGCGSSDPAPDLNVVSAVSVKERRSIEITGSVSDRNSFTLEWTQTSGPVLELSSTSVINPTLTAPSVDSDQTAVLQVTATNTKGKTSSATVTVSIVNNTAPEISADFAPIPEKLQASLQATITDDGTVSSIAWEQIAGPAVELEGTTTEVITFTAPAVTELTQLTFRITATDDDNESSQVTAHVDVEPNLLAFTISGKVVGLGFAESQVTASVNGVDYTSQADEAGAFELEVLVDDDLLNSVAVVTALGENERLSYKAFVSGFRLEEVVVAQLQTASLGNTAPQPITLTVSPVSTALYSLIVAENNGVIPAALEQLVFVEKSIDPQALIEAAAIAKILTENPDIELPEGINSISELLANTASYNQLLEEVNTNNPGLVAESILSISEDAELIEPIEVVSLSPIYFQTMSAATGFVPRSGERWQFNSDGTGNRATAFQNATFNWSLVNGDVVVNYTELLKSTAFPAPRVGLAGLTQSDIDKLTDSNIFQIEVTYTTTESRLTRLIGGALIDTFRVRDKTTAQMVPILTPQGTVDPVGELQELTTTRNLRKAISEAATPFSNQLVVGTWSLLNYYAEPFFNGPLKGFYLDRMTFNADGSGLGLDTEFTFEWSIESTVLTINFADGSKLEKQILDQSNNDFSVFTSAFGTDGKLIGSRAEYGFKIDEATSIADGSFVNPVGKYWQTTVNQWTPPNWQDGKLAFCTGNDAKDGACQNGVNYFGWQFNAGADGFNVASFDGIPPNFSPSFSDSLHKLSWSISSGKLSFEFLDCDDDDTAACRIREWRLLKTENGILGRRFYVGERQYWRFSADEEFKVQIGLRINIYEELAYEYWNPMESQSVSSRGLNSGLRALSRRILFDNQTQTTAF
ncbi:lipocalin-like domain-containing protein [Alkalimonas mucilaginosa]|uniref:Ig-like domain-containing protein n=1 Tax=Alkalimonas mucilaginosa TaxID=3057676 RepID=A0ABU7JI30_9GAMM|nr:hypothetical protein [Alkalimonas sp. MEB004]MEE2025327.1 hypothetical protein [Alkalimonas sp. MEB004]